MFPDILMKFVVAVGAGGFWLVIRIVELKV
jgi:hypothetical protein